ncbi:unnamed protein product [Nezara viridula]|uniref:Uncharacterized protein n=1 Tax=Nezara viridula TaxID=85310 RepID=A0A9P0HCM7_NEZVI|nr:unnamed protein product [Nezara viridula]
MQFENADFFSVWITSGSIVICFTIIILSCVCGCRKKIPKGNNAVSTATRSLPDLPVDSGEASEKLWSNTENNADTNSDLYATVEDANRKKRNLTSGLTVDSSYTPSQTDDSLSPYARLKGDHSYDQLQQNEHPYAQVRNGGAVPSTSQDTAINSSAPRSGEREREEGSRSKTPSVSEPPVDEIPAASAIAGSVPANHDLPYMTPPIPQQHFSGDSQDSGKGYTSISVREPLATILASRRGDPHYATVSDDSDEMYAAIDERNTSGSETYAQISPPSVLPLVIQHQQSIDGRSTSSDESPRRERRPANSPLPEPPAGIVDEMYAKVVKKRSPEHTPMQEIPNPIPSPPCSVTDEAPLAGYETVADPNYEELQDHDYASLSRSRYESVDPNYESVESSEPPYERVEAPDYEVVMRQGGEEVPHPPSPLPPNSPILPNIPPNFPQQSPVLDITRHSPVLEITQHSPILDVSHHSPDFQGSQQDSSTVQPPQSLSIPEIPQSVLDLYAQVNKSPDKSEKH